MDEHTPQPVCFPIDEACPQLAVAYVPIQPWGPVYEPEKGLEKGTIFPPLWKPYEPMPYTRGVKR